MKHKYLLLGLIVSFICVFNFSSAWETTVYCDKDTSGCSQNNLAVCCPVPKLTSFTCTSEGQIKVLRLSSDGLSVGSTTFNCPGVYITSNSSRLIVGYGNSNGFTSGYYVGETDVMPVSVLSTVVDGLEDSIIEFIPYVVYIGLGLLSAIIGFVSIKWLINRVRGKSLGFFRFKRKK